MGNLVTPRALRSRDTVALARGLLGKVLVRSWSDGRISRHRITEVEAYDGEHDLASHASRGPTARTAVMYRPGGVWYVYLCYGVHEMLNLVTGPAGYPAAILIRGLDAVSGPGRLTRRLGIDRRLNAAAASPDSGLWIEDEGTRVAPDAVRATPRIGVGYAGPVWAGKPWRFLLVTPGPAAAARPRPRRTRL